MLISFHYSELETTDMRRKESNSFSGVIQITILALEKDMDRDRIFRSLNFAIMFMANGFTESFTGVGILS